MATVSTIAIKLDAQTAALTKGFDKAQKETKKLGTSITKGLGGSFLKFNAIVTATTTVINAVKGAFGSFMETVEKYASMGDFADRIGLNVERYQELRLVTEQFGGNAEKIGTSLQRLTRRMAEAAQKGGPLADRMAELGYNVAEITKMSPDRQFLVMADAISKLGTAGDQAALAMATMDTEGVELLDTLRLGADGLNENMEAMGGYGVATQEQVKQSQAASAQLKLMKAAWKGMSDSIVLYFVPAITKAIEGLTTFIQKLQQSYREYRRWWAEITGGALEEPMVAVATNVEEVLGKAMAAVDEKVEQTVKKTVAAVARLAAVTTGGVGAVTSTSQAGFSALQEAKRRSRDRAEYEREMLAVQNTNMTLLEAINNNLTTIPVTL